MAGKKHFPARKTIADIAAGEAALNMLALMMSETVAILRGDDELKDMWRRVVQKREALVKSLQAIEKSRVACDSLLHRIEDDTYWVCTRTKNHEDACAFIRLSS